MTTRATTKRSTPTRSDPRLSDIAQQVAVPSGIVSTGWPAVETKAAELGLRPRPWQRSIGKLILAKRENGEYAASVGGAGMSIPRQSGKTFLVALIVFALCLLRPNLTVVWTAHRLRTAEETFKKMQGFARRKRIAPHVAKVTLGSGEGGIEFRNGSRILFGARERGFGRGFDEVDVLVFDEGQILTDAALDDMIPAANQSRQSTSALVLFMGTPPTDEQIERGWSEVFLRKRDEATSGEDEDTLWIEFGAPADYEPPPTTEPLTEADWRMVAVANPSFPDDTPRTAILRMRKMLGPESFRREGLGQFAKASKAKRATVFGDAWDRCGTGAELRPEAPAALGIAVSVDQAWASVAAASLIEREDLADPEAAPSLVSFVAPVARHEGTAWLAPLVKRIQTETDCRVVIDGKGPARHLVKDLEDADVAVDVVGLADYADACTRFLTRVRDGLLIHSAADELNDAVEGASWRNVGDLRVWGRRASVSDVSMLEAATLADHGAELSGATFNIY